MRRFFCYAIASISLSLLSMTVLSCEPVASKDEVTVGGFIEAGHLMDRGLARWTLPPTEQLVLESEELQDAINQVPLRKEFVVADEVEAAFWERIASHASLKPFFEIRCKKPTTRVPSSIRDRWCSVQFCNDGLISLLRPEFSFILDAPDKSQTELAKKVDALEASTGVLQVGMLAEGKYEVEEAMMCRAELRRRAVEADRIVYASLSERELSRVAELVRSTRPIWTYFVRKASPLILERRLLEAPAAPAN